MTDDRGEVDPGEPRSVAMTQSQRQPGGRDEKMEEGGEFPPPSSLELFYHDRPAWCSPLAT